MAAGEMENDLLTGVGTGAGTTDGPGRPIAPAPDVAPAPVADACPTPDELAVARELCAFISECPTMFHTNRAIRDRLEAEGFVYLPESSSWKDAITAGGRFYTVRNNSSLVAFKVGEHVAEPVEPAPALPAEHVAEPAEPAPALPAEHVAEPAEPASALPAEPAPAPSGARRPSSSFRFQIAAAHGDSPMYKVKSVPELEGPDEYLRLDVEAYGGMIDSTWFDRPLSLAGRVLVRQGDRIESRLVSFDRDLLVIPSLAIHFNREVNDGYKFNRQVDLCPLFSAGALKKGAFDEMLASELGCGARDILGRDLFLVNRVEPRVWGWADEFVSAPKLDDLECAFVALKAFLAAENPACATVYACFDNEEVGSCTKQGAMSTFLHDVLRRLVAGLGGDEEDYCRAVARSFLVSCDNVHAVHPNHAEKTDDVNCTHMNAGVVLKESANQKYTTDAFSRAVFAGICEKAGVPVQSFANRSDSAGGSTLGNLSNTQVSMHSCDIGLPQLAMHSSYETAGVRDASHGIRALTAFYGADLRIEGADSALLG